MSGANLVYNKIDGTGAAAILDSTSQVKRTIFSDQLKELRRQEAEARARRDDLLKELDNWDASGGFAHEQDLALEQINYYSDMFKEQMRAKGGVDADMQAMAKDLTRQMQSEKNRRIRREEHARAQIKLGIEMDYDPSSKEELDKWMQLSPEEKTQWEKDNGGMPLLRPYHVATIDDFSKEINPLTSMVRNKYTYQRGLKQVTTNDPAMTPEEQRVVTDNAAEQIFTIAHDDPENPSVVVASPKTRGNVKFTHDWIVANGYLDGRNPQSPEYKQQWFQGFHDLSTMDWRSRNDSETSDKVLPPRPSYGSGSKTDGGYVAIQEENGWVSMSRNNTSSQDSTPQEIIISYQYTKDDGQTVKGQGPARVYSSRPVDVSNPRGNWEVIADIQIEESTDPFNPFSPMRTVWKKKEIIAPANFLEAVDKVYFDNNGTYYKKHGLGSPEEFWGEKESPAEILSRYGY